MALPLNCNHYYFGPVRWLLFFYSMPSRPSTRRVFIWRKLKSAGAVLLHQSAFFLPAGKEHGAFLKELQEEVTKHGGAGRVLEIRIEGREEQAAMREEFVAQADEEYGEFIEKCDDLHAELTKERGKNHFSFAEVEENDAEIKKLKSWLGRIQARDFFGAPLGAKAADALEAAEADFAEYEREVTSREIGTDGTDAPAKRRR